MITEYLPKDVKKVVSPFIGGGSVEVALAKELGLEVVGYDIFDLLANFWQQVTVNGEEIYKKLSELKPTKEEFARVKGILSEHWTKENGYDGKLDPIDAAAYYYFNMQLSYGPAFLGWMSSIYESEKKYNSTLEKIKDFYVPNLKVYCKRFEESIPEIKVSFYILTLLTLYTNALIAKPIRVCIQQDTFQFTIRDLAILNLLNYYMSIKADFCFHIMIAHW
jgi:DNA adenine methylase